MPAYRLELWFDYNAQSLNWGAAVANANAPGYNPANPFATGGSAIQQSTVNGKQVVTITGAGNNSTMDVYLFDVSGDGVSRDLQWIEVDFEKANQGAGGGSNPDADAAGLRTGLSGLAFMGASDGGANGTTTGVGQENTICNATTLTAQRRWSGQNGFESLTPGNYTFTVACVVTPHNGGLALQIDPEMDIS